MKKILSGMFVFVASFLFLITNADASFDGNLSIANEGTVKSNNLYIEHVHANNVTINVTGTTGYRIANNLTANCQSMMECNIFTYQNVVKNTKNVSGIEINAAERANATVTVTYDYVGTYKGEKVGAILTIDNIPAVTENSTDWNAWFQVSDSLYEGLHYSGAYIQGHRQTYKFFKTSDTSKTPINLEGTYITFNSNNRFDLTNETDKYHCFNQNLCNESIYFNSSQLANVEEASVLAESNMQKSTNLKDKYAFGVSPVSSDFDDYLGGATFEKNSVTVKFKNYVSFYPDSSLTGNVTYVWMALSTAPIHGIVPRHKPVKYERNLKKERVKSAEFKIGDQVVFEIDQKVNTLGTDILKRYTLFKISDVLPQEVDYVSAKMYQGTTEVTDGTINYDSAKHEVTWTANNTLLQEMPLMGETYTLKITTKANSKFTKKTTNDATVFINQKQTKTNVVELTPPETSTTIKVPNTLANIPTYVKVAGILFIILALVAVVYAYKGGKPGASKKEPKE